MDQWFTGRPVAGLRRRLVCFPHAGGAASAFRDWPALLPPGVELMAVQYPGRQNRRAEPCVEQMDELADRIAHALSPHLGVPVAFFGHSMGSSVAYEVALRLERNSGLVLEHLFVSGRAAPHRIPADRPRPLDDAAILASVRALGGPDNAAYDDPGLLPLLMPSLRADYRLIGGYRPSEPVPLAAPITAYGGRSDPACPIELLDTWSELTVSDRESRTFTGGHFYLAEHREALVADICERLTRAPNLL